MKRILFAGAVALAMTTKADDAKTVKLITLDPGHFHAALVQKFMYPQVDATVHVYAPAGDDLQQHLKRIDGFNARTNPPPTKWTEKVYTGDDFFEKMLADKAGNVVVLAGNNAKKTEYILKCVKAGLNVLADKPMAITPHDFETLREALKVAKEKNVLLYDIMTERSEVTTILQKELAAVPDVFGELQKGTVEQPAISKESVHHYCKEVAGVPLKRPQWFFDVRQQGEGIVDVTTHLVDLIQWEAFPGQVLSESDVEMHAARRWTTAISPAQFEKVTGAKEYPDYLKKDVDSTGTLQVFCNGEMNYTLRGIHAKVSVIWNFEAPPGAKDTHYSIMRGSKANLVIRQGKEQNYKPMLYVEKIGSDDDAAFESKLRAAIDKLQAAWPGVAFHRDGAAWLLDIPAKYDIGHEAHFAQVTERYLKYLAEGKLPDWEVPDIIVKNATIMKAFEMSRPK
jgi:predicted dehydrogenase